MKAQKQLEPQDDNAQLLQEVRRDMLRFDRWLATPESQHWLDDATNEDAERSCSSNWEKW